MKNIIAQEIEKGIEDKVKILGLRSDVNILLSVMDVFLLSSWSEAVALVTIEAQANGVPVHGY